MPLTIGTSDGVYRIGDGSLRRVDRILDDVKVFSLTRADGIDYVGAAAGLYRSTDDGESWTTLDLPVDAVPATAASPDGEHVYAGTMPVGLYASTDQGDTWQERESLHEIPSRADWYQQGGLDLHVRTLATHPDAPDRLVVGVDGGGVHVSDDRGRTWATRMEGITQYIHHLLVRGPDEYLASTDAGLFWTRDGGRWWDFLDDHMRHRYFKAAFGEGDTVFAGGARAHPSIQRLDGTAAAALYEIDFGTDDRRLPMRPVSYPGEPDEHVLNGTVLDGDVFAGTSGGRLLRRTDGEWEAVMTLPGGTKLRQMESY